MGRAPARALFGALGAAWMLMTGCSLDTDGTESARADDPTAFAGTIAPPVAERRPRVLEAHGRRRVDDYYWLRDDSREDPAVIGYLEAENAYVNRGLAHLDGLRRGLYEELKSRIRMDDDSVPYRDGDWLYQTRYRAGLEHPIYVRSPVAGGDEVVMLDLNELAETHDYYEVGALAVSEDGRLLAYTEDTVSREEYVVRVRDLLEERQLDAAVPGAAESLAWANDHETLFYVRRDPGTLIPRRVFRHRLGTDPAEDVLVYEEQDERFAVDIGKSRDGRWIVIHTIGSSTRTVPRRRPGSSWRGPRGTNT